MSTELLLHLIDSMTLPTTLIILVLVNCASPQRYPFIGRTDLSSMNNPSAQFLDKRFSCIGGYIVH